MNDLKAELIIFIAEQIVFLNKRFKDSDQLPNNSTYAKAECLGQMIMLEKVQNKIK